MKKSLNALINNNEDNDKPSQLKIVLDYLFNNIATNSMVSAVTGIPRPNICRIKRKLEEMGLLWVVKKDTCKETNYKACYLTTNPNFAPNELYKQFKLF